jgi:hypothetical protein
MGVEFPTDVAAEGDFGEFAFGAKISRNKGPLRRLQYSG